VAEGQIDEPGQERARAGRSGRIQQIRRRQAQRSQLGGRQVAPAVGQVGRHVAQHVGHL